MSIELKNGIVHYYGNKAGFVEDDRAIVDTMFAVPELSGWLAERRYAVEWRGGVYDKLNGAEEVQPLKRVRIWQLKSDVEPGMRFIGYDELLEKFGEPNSADYDIAYDGQPGTNDLDALFELFNVSRPEGFAGHSLSMSDVAELYDDDGGGSEFFYVDRVGFREIGFGGSEQKMTMG
jgi:hypothetical protein